MWLGLPLIRLCHIQLSSLQVWETSLIQDRRLNGVTESQRYGSMKTRTNRSASTMILKQGKADMLDSKPMTGGCACNHANTRHSVQCVLYQPASISAAFVYPACMPPVTIHRAPDHLYLLVPLPSAPLQLPLPTDQERHCNTSLPIE